MAALWVEAAFGQLGSIPFPTQAVYRVLQKLCCLNTARSGCVVISDFIQHLAVIYFCIHPN